MGEREDTIAPLVQGPLDKVEWRVSVAIEGHFDAHVPAVLAFVGLFVTDGARREPVAAVALIQASADQSSHLPNQTRVRAVLAALASLNDDLADNGQTPSQSTVAFSSTD